MAVAVRPGGGLRVRGRRLRRWVVVRLRRLRGAGRQVDDEMVRALGDGAGGAGSANGHTAAGAAVFPRRWVVVGSRGGG